MRSIPKWTKVVSIVILSIITFLLIAVVGIRAYFNLPLSNYFSASEQAFKIPGINDNFVPQGLCYDEERKQFLVSGYFSDKTASAVYTVDKESGKAKQVRLGYEDGSPMRRHACGVAFYKDWVYVAGSSANCVMVYSYSEIVEANNGDSVDMLGRFSLENPKNKENDYITASFLTVYKDNLIVGEYHYGDEYPLLDSHEIITSVGDKHGAMAIEFKLSEREEFGISSNPVRALSIPDKVQGMTVNGDKIYLSTSYGLNNSVLYEYKFAGINMERQKELIGRNVSIYAIDSSCLLNAYNFPPMAEGIAFLDGKLYTMTEFACNKHILGKFTSAKWCYATNLKNMSI